MYAFISVRQATISFKAFESYEGDKTYKRGLKDTANEADIRRRLRQEGKTVIAPSPNLVRLCITALGPDNHLFVEWPEQYSEWQMEALTLILRQLDVQNLRTFKYRMEEMSGFHTWDHAVFWDRLSESLTYAQFPLLEEFELECELDMNEYKIFVDVCVS